MLFEPHLGGHERRAGPADERPRPAGTRAVHRHRVPRRVVPLRRPTSRGCCAGVIVHPPRRLRDRPGRPQRQREEHRGEAAVPVLRPHPRQRSGGTAIDLRELDGRRAAPPDRRGVPGLHALRALGRGEHRGRRRRRDGRPPAGRGAASWAGIYRHARGAASGLRHDAQPGQRRQSTRTTRTPAVAALRRRVAAGGAGQGHVPRGNSMVILDEPSSGLDPQAEHELHQRLRRPARGPDEPAHLAPAQHRARRRRGRRPVRRHGRRVRHPPPTWCPAAAATPTCSTCRRIGYSADGAGRYQRREGRDHVVSTRERPPGTIPISDRQPSTLVGCSRPRSSSSTTAPSTPS